MIGKLLDHRYQVIRVLATGGFGQTYIAQDTRRPGNPICVVKHLKPASSDPRIFDTAKRLFQNEADTLEKLGNHDQIPRLLAYFDENQEFFLVQEFIDGYTLSEELIPGQRWSESQVIHLLLEILGILEFVHQQGVIHRDIKPDNIIRRSSDYRLVLVDFGSVKQLRTHLVAVGAPPTATVAIGTPGYMPTEQGQGKPRPNSDIYSLGIIAIQALTGIPASQLQEDPDTGEFIWQHLISVNPQLAAVLTKMVRYHFKDRYQNVTETLQACRDLVDPNSPPVTPLELPKKPSNLPTKPAPSPVLGQQKTLAVAPANSAPAISKPTRKDPNRPDPLPLLIAILLAGGAAALAANVYPKLQNLTANLTGNDVATAKNCSVVVEGNSNVRSEPSAINSGTIVKTITKDTKFEVTGRRTKRGWVEVKLNSGRLAWANSDVITNNNQWVSCLRDKDIGVQTVDDSSLIATRSVPKPQPKSSVVIPTPEISENSTSDSGNSEAAKPADNSAQIVQQARQKYESGDLLGAIATLRSIPANAASGIKETAKIIDQWQQDWAKAEALSNEINTAIDQGQWDKVLAYRDNPEKLPNIKYWRDKLDPLFKQAAENLAKQVIPKKDNQVNQNPPQQESVNTDKPATIETPNGGL
ncbi:serine/threonine protein kinase [Cylindrospermum stagnale PCC 7417]|uniref:non-specific serine/threonine protein kinase n=1 Tax=Cylindrospermum stagnale PCC 7417 TaxID=56107 RepID=K9WWH8_9NOST|nr:protein kinase [Cylindrospermum stagnale]AFZ24553.1 serine/threonine protein kinase [Cylindrospermum stagnale PCC 7417]